DLGVVDGGKGRVARALGAMAEVGGEGVEAVGLAKMRVLSAPRSAEIERSEERGFLPGQSNPVILERHSNALFLLQRGRDEAHRFAITHHKKLRARQTLFPLSIGFQESAGRASERCCALLAASRESKKQHWKSCSRFPP